MNKNKALIIIGVLAAIGLIANALLLILAPEGADKFGDMLLNLLLVLGGFAGLTYAQGKQGESIEAIKHQTNGTLTKRDDEIAALRAALAAHAPDALVSLDTASTPIQPRAPATRAEAREQAEDAIG